MATVTITKAEVPAITASKLALGGFGKGNVSGDLYQRLGDTVVNWRTKQVSPAAYMTVLPLAEGDTISLTVDADGKATGGYTTYMTNESFVLIDTLPVGAAGKGKYTGNLFIQLGNSRALSLQEGAITHTVGMQVKPLVKGDSYTVTL